MFHRRCLQKKLSYLCNKVNGGKENAGLSEEN